MSNRYKGAVISATPPTTSTSAASGVWTLEQQMQAQAAGTWPSPPIFVEDMFSTFLYVGSGGANSYVNNIDLAGKGGMVWIKSRDNTSSNWLWDTSRGALNGLESNSTSATTSFSGVSAFNSNGFSLGSDSATNQSGINFVSWTFAKQQKFFDIVTWTGNGSARTIAHNLGSTPGCIIIKCLNTTFDWIVWHRSFVANNYNAFLNTSDAAGAYSVTSSTAPTDTVFSLTTSPYTNQNGSTYVAYLFAHNAGGFPVSGGGSTNGITCGSYTGNGSTTGPVVNLGYEPQWVMIKKSSDAESWYIYDNMRGVVTGAVSAADRKLRANNGGVEGGLGANDPINFGATGFNIGTTDNELNISGGTYIYIAIRRGPMKTPTVGTSVYNGIARTGTGATATVSGVGFSPDLFIGQIRGTAGYWNGVVDRLRGVTQRLVTSQENIDGTTTDAVTSFTMDGVTLGADSNGFVNESGKTYIEWNFKRAPSFFDEVCWTGTGSATTQTHNLSVVPELIFVKRRSTVDESWAVYSATIGNTKFLRLNQTLAATSSADRWNNTTPTSSVFTLGIDSEVNASGQTYVGYLFATLAGVSKVGSYTGTGAAQTINCGFTAGSRFVMIKRTDSTGDWYVWDSARGIIPANDPYLALNSTAAEVTGTDYVDTTSVGFDITSTAPAAINASGGTYIFLAIA